MKTVKYVAKAIVGFIAPGAVLVGHALMDSSDGGTTITQAEWLTALIACVVSAAAVFSVPNGPKPDANPPV